VATLDALDVLNGQRTGLSPDRGVEVAADESRRHQEASKQARWTHPGKGRYYAAIVQRNLFGQWEVLRYWGALSSALGSQCCDPLPDEASGTVALGRIAARRERRGYMPDSGSARG
jgi:hypothetical protein